MRILTRYILREIVSHALLGGVLFTFILYMRDLGRILDLVVRNSSSLVSVLKIFLFILPNTLISHHPHVGAGGHPAWPEPSRRRQRNHRHARLRHRAC